MKERLKNLKVGKKLQFSFTLIMAAFIITTLVAIGGILLINSRMSTFYTESYANTKLQLEIRKDVQMVGKSVLWALTTEDDAVTQEKIADANTYGGNVASNIEKLQESFNNKEMVATLADATAKLKSVRARVMDLALKNQNEQALELFTASIQM